MPTSGMSEIFGWESTDFWDLIPSNVDNVLRQGRFDQVSTIWKAWRENGITKTNSPNTNVYSSKHILKTGGKQSKVSVIRVIKSKLFELLNILDNDEDDKKPEKIDKMINSESNAKIQNIMQELPS
jgi:hypothetical protein